MHCRGLCLFPSPPYLLHILALRLTHLELLIKSGETRHGITRVIFQTPILDRIGFWDRKISLCLPDVAEAKPGSEALDLSSGQELDLRCCLDILHAKPVFFRYDLLSSGQKN